MIQVRGDFIRLAFYVLYSVLWWWCFIAFYSIIPCPSAFSMVVYFIFFFILVFLYSSSSLNIKRCILTLITYLLLLVMRGTFRINALNFLKPTQLRKAKRYRRTLTKRNKQKNVTDHRSIVLRLFISCAGYELNAIITGLLLLITKEKLL